METDRKSLNLQIGNRLREARRNMNVSRAEFAQNLDVSEEHYRKLEAGSTGLSSDKLMALYEKYDIDPTYLITGKCGGMEEFNVEYYVANSSREQRNRFLERVLAYVTKLIVE